MATPAPLFLDAARLGAMSPTAQLAARDFARLAGEGLSTLYWEEFFRGQLFPPSHLPGLAGWRGIAGVADSIRCVVRAPCSTPVLLASRTAALMQVAVEQLATRCRRVLTTDTLWPPYRTLLDAACRMQDVPVSTVRIRDAVCRGELSRARLIARVVQAFSAGRCDGVLLSSVSHDGVRLPLAPLVRELRSQHPQAYVVIDGAQEFAHVPVRLAATPCDVYVAGVHKWLGAHQPLGIALLPHARTAAAVEQVFRERLDDPLFRYVQSLNGHSSPAPPETVNLTPMVCAHGALSDFLQYPLRQTRRFRRQQANAGRAAAVTLRSGWTPMVPPRGLRSGILILRCRDAACSARTADELQRQFSTAGVTLTAYEDGFVRLSLPCRTLDSAEWGRLAFALAPIAGRHRQLVAPTARLA